MKKTLFAVRSIMLLFLFFNSLVLFSAPVEFEKAEQTAYNYLLWQNQVRGQYMDISLSGYQVYSSDSVDIFYFINYYPEGWVIVSSDDSTYPIIGYNVSGNLSISDLDYNILTFLSIHIDALKESRSENINNETALKEWHRILENRFDYEKGMHVLPVNTKWGQDAAPPEQGGGLWNALCPEDADGSALVGSLPLAMAQIMKYWNYPEQGQGQNSYFHEKYGQIEADFEDTTYEWSEMEDLSPVLATQLLLFHAGVALNADYGIDHTSSSIDEIAFALINYFDYDSEIEAKERDEYLYNDWIILLKHQIDNDMPVLYKGIDDNSQSHGWVVHGYDQDDNFAVNWGWNGSADGFYSLKNGPFPDNKAGKYQYGQRAILNIFRKDLQTPANLNAEAISDTEIDLSWDYDISNIDGFQIERKTGINGEWGLIETVPEDHITYSDTSLNSNTVYYYRIRAYIENNHSAYSNISYANTGQPSDTHDTFEISDIDDLIELASNSSKWDNHIIQTADIDMTGIDFTPIGNASTPFTGIYDGNNYKIINLSINASGSNYQGFFGYTSNAKIVNVRLEDIDIHGNNYTGGLAGYTTAGTQIRHSYTTGTVTGGDEVGGLVGRADGSSEYLADCYSISDVSGASRVGGFIGFQRYSRIYRSYSAGSVSGTGSDIGGFIGRTLSGLSLYCYWDTDTSGQEASAGGMGRTTEEMYQQSNFAGFNFTTLWQIDEGVNYPEFQNISDYAELDYTDLTDLEGSGTESDPYIIYNAHELNAVRQDLTAYYRLGADIDLSDTVIWNAGAGWEPIGNNTDRFNGRLDGDGFTISNLYMNRSSQNYQGLFGYIENAELIDLKLDNLSIYGSNYTGGLAAYSLNSDIIHCSLFGEIQINGGTYTGGLVGYSSGSQINNSSVSGSVYIIGEDYTGGLAGYTTAGTQIRHSYTTGAVTGGNEVGGLVGRPDGSSEYIADCYSRSDVSGTSRVGGFIGFRRYALIYRSYSVGFVSGTGSDIGGFIGRTLSGLSHYCYWDTETSGQEESAGGMGRTTEEMYQQSNFVGFNFTTLWQIEEGENYPEFQDFSDYEEPDDIDLTDLEGSGTESDPYVIYNAHELNAVRQGLTAYYRLGADIDLSDTVIWNAGAGWEPIGNSTDSFNGRLDGYGFTISNLFVNRSSQNYQGLFGYIENAELIDLKLENLSIYGRNYTGGLVGYSSGSQLNNSSVSGSVYILGGDYTGGLIGYITDGTDVRVCYTTGIVTGGEEVGGLVGHTDDTSDYIADCYSRADISGVSSVGGFIGYRRSGRIYRSYSTGSVSGTGSNIGGFTGRTFSGSVHYSYWDTETSGQETSAGGIGRTTEEMYQQSNFAGFNFTTLWKIEEGDVISQIILT